MTFAFATCDRKRALEFLQKLYPSRVVADTEESVKDLLDIIAADEMRVCDPEFHGGQMIYGRNQKTDTAERARAALEKAGLCFSQA